MKADTHFWLRNVAEFVKTAHRFASGVTVVHDGRKVDGKSMLDLMAFPIRKGDLFEVHTDGEDAVDCLEALELTVLGMKDPFYYDAEEPVLPSPIRHAAAGFRPGA